MWFCADNVGGLKPRTEARDTPQIVVCGRGALRGRRSRSASSGGVLSSEDAGISSAKTGANPVHRKPKVSAARFVRCRSVGPKARAKAVVDGCQVHIPEPGVKVKRLGTRTGESSGCWSASSPSGDERRPGRAKAKRLDGLAEKSQAGTTRSTVPQTDTGRQVEDTKVFERTLVKELGNLTP